MRIKLALFVMLLILSPVMAQDATLTPTATPIPPPTVLTIWLPDTLFTSENAAALTLLEEQIAEFVETEDNVQIEIRLRRVGGSGGIMSTLQSASRIAPGALPDLTLMRRQDVVTAVRDGLIESIEGDVSSQVLVSLDNALRLGQVNEELYALPYVLDLRHVVYRPQDDVDYTSWSYDAVLERGQMPLFGASRIAGLNDVFYLQYVAAGGTLSREGVLGLNRSALQNTFAFYEDALAAEIIDAELLNYSTFLDYQADFVAENVDSGVFSSTTYLRMLDDERNLAAAPVPTLDGQNTSILNGWSWVLVSSDATQQDVAWRYLEWMMAAPRQLAFAEATYMLPSRRESLEAALPVRVDETLYEALLDNAILPLTDSEGGTLARAFQTAFNSILNGTSTANEATEAVEAQAG